MLRMVLDRKFVLRTLVPVGNRLLGHFFDICPVLLLWDDPKKEQEKSPLPRGLLYRCARATPRKSNTQLSSLRLPRLRQLCGTRAR